MPTLFKLLFRFRHETRDPIFICNVALAYKTHFVFSREISIPTNYRSTVSSCGNHLAWYRVVKDFGRSIVSVYSILMFI